GTPGLHTPTGGLQSFMQATARRAGEDVDLVCLVVDAAQRAHPDRLVLEPLEAYRGPVFCVLNKADLVRPRERMLPVLEAWRGAHAFRELIPVSATEGTNCDRLLELILGILPEHPPFFPEDATSDQPETFWVAEIIREKVFLLTREEVPYAVAVRVQELVERKEPACLYIRATVFVEQESQKGIPIGKGGSMLNRIGTASRRLRSRCAGALELFTLGELIFFDTGRSELVRIDHFDILHPFDRVRGDLERLGQAAWIVECVTRLTAEHDRHVALYALLVRSLRALEGPVPPARVAVCFGVRALETLGHRPRLDACTVCGRAYPFPRPALGPSGVVCEACAREDTGAVP